MLFQLLFAERIVDLRSLHLNPLTFTALAVFNFNANHHDTVWDVSNRICDRYFPGLKQACSSFVDLDHR
jgi:hypothetical protein